MALSSIYLYMAPISTPRDSIHAAAISIYPSSMALPYLLYLYMATISIYLTHGPIWVSTYTEVALVSIWIYTWPYIYLSIRWPYIYLSIHGPISIVSDTMALISIYLVSMALYLDYLIAWLSISIYLYMSPIV